MKLFFVKCLALLFLVSNILSPASPHVLPNKALSYIMPIQAALITLGYYRETIGTARSGIQNKDTLQKNIQAFICGTACACYAGATFNTFILAEIKKRNFSHHLWKILAYCTTLILYDFIYYQLTPTGDDRLLDLIENRPPVFGACEAGINQICDILLRK